MFIPATVKQRSYIRVLWRRRYIRPEVSHQMGILLYAAEQDELSKAEASQLIDWLQDQPKTKIKPYPKDLPRYIPPPLDGLYTLDGSVWKIQSHVEDGTLVVLLRQLRHLENRFVMREYSVDAADRIANLAKRMTVRDIERFGAETATCAICGKKLMTSDYVGEECLERLLHETDTVDDR